MEDYSLQDMGLHKPYRVRIATVAILLPAFLLILGTLPFWDDLRHNPKVMGALMGVNAAVVGILISAFSQPIWTSSWHQLILHL